MIPRRITEAGRANNVRNELRPRMTDVLWVAIAVAESFINRYSSERAITLNVRTSRLRVCVRASALRMRLYYPEYRRCATGRKGHVFIRRDEMHSEFRAGRKIAATAQWPSQWSGQVVYGPGAENRSRVYQPARKNPCCSLSSRARPRCLSVDLSMRSTLPIYDRRFEFELNARVGGIVPPLPGLIKGLTKFSPDPSPD